jgi:predicted GH43/DUF377 family glycosyl hydrolase
MTEPLARRTGVEMHADPSRVVAQLFLPGEESHVAHSRAGKIAARVLALDDATIDRLAAQLVRDFASRHRLYPRLLDRNASIVAGHVGAEVRLSPERRLVLGASFTAEYASEAAALCNPSAFPHPDQSELEPGQLRVAMSLRAIGEGHISSIGFGTAVVGPGPTWTFCHRDVPVVAAETSPAVWHTDQLRAVLADQGPLDELSHVLLRVLPLSFDAADLDHALAHLPRGLLDHPSGYATVDRVRRMVSSAYQADFPEDTTLAQRLLQPSATEERDGMEDARFTRFVSDDGTVEFRATYTAYDGRQIAPRLLVSADLLHFRTHRLAGPAARNKGMALFPRLVGGRHLALCRTDGENVGITDSVDGFVWSQPRLIHEPAESWEMLQVGNCGPPIETDRGWLVLTHGVGPMRTYSIGALLLDLDDPSTVIGHLADPLLAPNECEQDGYVPNVVYSCGGLVHDGRLWLPYGIDDTRIGVAWVPVADLIAELTAES